jgi:hypothetical protein
VTPPNSRASWPPLTVAEHHVQNQQRERREAERQLPRLFAQCDALISKFERSSVAHKAALRRGDVQATVRAGDEMLALDKPWGELVDKVQKTIELVAGEDPDKTRRLTIDSIEHCRCDRTPSGHCRDEASRLRNLTQTR